MDGTDSHNILQKMTEQASENSMGSFTITIHNYKKILLKSGYQINIFLISQ